MKIRACGYSFSGKLLHTNVLKINWSQNVEKQVFKYFQTSKTFITLNITAITERSSKILESPVLPNSVLRLNSVIKVLLLNANDP